MPLTQVLSLLPRGSPSSLDCGGVAGEGFNSGALLCLLPVAGDYAETQTSAVSVVRDTVGPGQPGVRELR